MPAVDAMDVKIVPTITTDDPNKFQYYMTEYPKFAKRIHLDIMDGTFVQNKTVQISAIVQFPAEIKVDIHLMAANPSAHLEHILRLKPYTCFLHAEAGENILPVFEQLKAAGIKCGLVLLQKTNPGVVKEYIQNAQSVIIFAGTLGAQGGKADMLQTEKVKMIRSINPGCEVCWDGGANLSNVRALAHNDINIINVGSFIATAEDPSVAFGQLIEEKSKRGVVL
ncbi:MAG: hypothetical protein Q4E47_01675 [Candidatus Saccharibacteria bacterium]|nr:hypothetical protein [Candidatus Saccharibacteria bacterium]